MRYTIDNCKLKQLSSAIVSKDKGVVNMSDTPFDVKRIYYLYSVPENEERAGHSHYKLQQYLIAVKGSFTVKLFDGERWKEIRLDSSDTALHLVPGIWRELEDFTEGSVCLVLASEKYDESDYIRNMVEFVKWKEIL
ncbi:MAG: hypothetical protein ACI8ZO_001533 [Flavobacteriales bacterium]|jgi:hypothetical protein